jgi:hypothetical protein
MALRLSNWESMFRIVSIRTSATVLARSEAAKGARAKQVDTSFMGYKVTRFQLQRDVNEDTYSLHVGHMRW